MDGLQVLSALCLITCLLQRTSPAPSTSSSTPGLTHGIVIDAGSSGSRVRVYSVQYEDSLPRVEEIGNLRVKPGLAEFATRLTEVAEYLNPLLLRAQELVPRAQWPTTPIYLMSTAGLRLVDAAQSSQLFTEVRGIFSNKTACPFLFQHRDQARVLSGEEEGVYTWITVNYLREYFGKGRPYSDTHGILEMGGASTQIAFIPTTPILANKFYVSMAGEKYPLYAHSYLYFGATYMDIRVKAFLAAESPGSTELEDPCMLTGDVKHQPAPNRTDTDSLQFIGTGNSTACEAILETFQRQTPTEFCYPKPCAIGDIYQPVLPEHMLFTAVSAYVYAPAALGALEDDRTLTPRILREKALLYIQKNLTEAIEQIGESRRQYASAYAMMGLYLPMLLQRSYGFHSDSTQVIATNDVDGKGIAWTLGALLYELESGMLTSSRPTGNPDPCNASGRTSHHLSALYTALMVVLQGICLQFLVRL
ncbi:ectonucleoside triphosphate diphosphohydrolase 1 isoform X1 [Lingula anatina]|uniref:Ectonucleoside triphosphate diphosphohydrolase 1 isoform X1 n=1 Tax=Lingula anatina TaxID=7574 RepID=A0A1S3JBP4_LINAN|nr:ectonucleoside triphosphate diphosphohydrolase 1 isoform X1 [Lingula anatina]XP_013407828.1 ectonucleoside triphosphate diphosphohydrolase 1 isoform X1 [Lingula anatina]XP_013407830.1 ectonucleoside triphosphate diphosphohydrolase 1 isoform X1 [Lingula anatina]|eukprot:XP_013407826.1 ectonucleoside triphosphate diphosphohydrolase 1 isoform X1 [Lingula anatina]